MGIFLVKNSNRGAGKTFSTKERQKEIERIKLSIEIKESNIEVFQEKVRILKQELMKLKRFDL